MSERITSVAHAYVPKGIMHKEINLLFSFQYFFPSSRNPILSANSLEEMLFPSKVKCQSIRGPLTETSHLGQAQ